MNLHYTARTPGLAPSRAHAGDAGLDLRADLDEPFTISKGARALIGTGVTVAIPPGHVGMIAPRSGMALNDGITVTNAPGIIDSGYRGELGVIIHNLGARPYRIEPGQKIAQLVIVPCAFPQLVAVDDLDNDNDGRGTGGFGSTGK